MPNQTAATVPDKLVQQVFLKLGVPAQLHTDQGRNFESDPYILIKGEILRATRLRQFVIYWG